MISFVKLCMITALIQLNFIARYTAAAWRLGGQFHSKAQFAPTKAAMMVSTSVQW